MPWTLYHNGNTYYYVTNLQGDVIAILDSQGNTLVTYTYDAWGNLLSTTGAMAATLGVNNLLRYRGYVYDTETQLYYLQSRYYNPEIGRFINADALVSTGQGILGYNMFVYCGNNPVANSDPFGLFFERTAGGGGGGGLAYAGPASGHIVRPTIPVSVPQIIPFIPPSLDFYIETLRAEKFDIMKTISLSKKKNKSKGKNIPKKPNVKYPGNDPTKSPGDGYEWRGNPNEPIGGNKGAWVNNSTGEQWHPDLNHSYPKGPHWDYTDIFGYVWSVFEDGRIIIWW